MFSRELSILCRVKFVLMSLRLAQLYVIRYCRFVVLMLRLIVSLVDLVRWWLYLIGCKLLDRLLILFFVF